MTLYVAFLRGMNLGRRRIQNVELCESFEALGFTNVVAFLASGNVIFKTRKSAPAVRQAIERGLQKDLGYDVPTYLRTAAEITAVAAFDPFAKKISGGKEQVVFFDNKPTSAAKKAINAAKGPDDLVAIGPRELHWLPPGGLSDATWDPLRLPQLGPGTVRTKRTVERIVSKFVETAS